VSDAPAPHRAARDTVGFDLAQGLAQRRTADLYRRRLTLDGAPGVEVIAGGERLLAFCSNDYLGLAAHPEVVAALKSAADRYGVGAGASHLVSGHTDAHRRLEERLAELTGRPGALAFSTGYMANLGVATALLGRGDTICEDRVNHASLLDAGLVSRAQTVRYAHADPAALDSRLASRGSGRRLVATDGVFSMDGDIAPLPGLLAAARRHGAMLLVDDAHGIGVLGSTGGGTLEHHGIAHAPDVAVMGTLGKAFGTFGAFVAGEPDLIDTLVQSARTYLYTTATPPALAEAARAAVDVACREPWRRERLRDTVRRFRAGARQLGLPVTPWDTPIQPLVFGASAAALEASRVLRERGLLVTAIRPPTVPRGTARLRITFSAAHEPEHVDRLLDALSGVWGG